MKISCGIDCSLADVYNDRILHCNFGPIKISQIFQFEVGICIKHLCGC